MLVEQLEFDLDLAAGQISVPQKRSYFLLKSSYPRLNVLAVLKLKRLASIIGVSHCALQFQHWGYVLMAQL